MEEAEQASPRHLILDFTDLSYIDSAGLGLLALTYRKLSTMGYQLVIANAQSSVQEILRLTNMDKIFSLHDSVATASHAVKTGLGQKS